MGMGAVSCRGGRGRVLGPISGLDGLVGALGDLACELGAPCELGRELDCCLDDPLSDAARGLLGLRADPSVGGGGGGARVREPRGGGGGGIARCLPASAQLSTTATPGVFRALGAELAGAGAPRMSSRVCTP